MKKHLFILWALFCFTVFAQEKPEIPKIVILDIMSQTVPQNDLKMFTDILRTELYKLDYFNIVERGVIQQYLKDAGLANKLQIEDSMLLEIGQSMDVDKLLVCTLNSYADTIVLNIRIIDVKTSYLDFTENIYIQDNNQIFDALKDLVLKIELYYIEKSKNGDPLSHREKLYQTWKLLGADEKVATDLSSLKINPAKYLDMRQYDITFLPDNYLEVVKSDYDEQNLYLFFKEGIPYKTIKKAFSLGLFDIENYKENFKKEGYTFTEYLTAYENNIVTPEDFAEYKKGFKKLQFHLGLGGVANDLPIANADFTFFLLQTSAEYYISNFQRGLSKASTEMGLYFMNVIAPSPFFQINAYIGQFPFYLKGSVGVVAEVFFGGHIGVFGKLGVEVNSLFEFNLMYTFAGTQPKISYTDFKTKIDEPGYEGIIFPYMAALFTYKL